MNMTWDSGGAIILSSIITVVLMWIGSLVSKHFSNNEEVGDSAHERLNAVTAALNQMQLDFARYQTHVAETYHRKEEQREFERAVFRKLDEIVNLIHTKADKDH